MALNGDILILPEFIPQLIAKHPLQALRSTATEHKHQTTTIRLSTTSSSTQQAATLRCRGNGSEGGATSGTAMTNLTILNLTGMK